MSDVAVQKIGNGEHKTLPVFDEIGTRLEKIRRRAFELFEKRGKEFGTAIEDWLKAEREIMGWTAAEIAEKTDAYELQLTLPGFDAKDVKVTATPTEIVVHAAAKKEQRTEKDNILWTEFGSNEVYRWFEMPKPIDVDKTAATLEKGILKVRAAKAAAELKKPIAIAA